MEDMKGLQLSKEKKRHFKTWNFFTILLCLWVIFALLNPHLHSKTQLNRNFYSKHCPVPYIIHTLPLSLFLILCVSYYLLLSSSYPQCCGTVTIYYGSGSGFGSDFWKVMVPVPVPVPVPTFEIITVPVPVPAPYLDHKKQIKKKKILEIFFDFC